MPPFICFSACTMIENATIRYYIMTLQYYPTILTKVLVTGGEPSSCKLTQRRHSRGWTHTSSFSLPASSLTNKPPSVEQRGRQDRLFRLTGKTPLVLLPSMPDSLYQLCTMNCGRRQALNFLAGRERVTLLRKDADLEV